MSRVVVIGEINVDLVLTGLLGFPVPGKEVLADGLALALGSASAICAVGLARLGNAVSFVGKVGADPWGDFCRDVLTREGLDIAAVERDPALQTGLTISLATPRDRALITYVGSIAALAAEDVPEDAWRGSDHLHVSSYYLQRRLRPGCKALFARARAAGVSVSLDPGFDPDERWEADLVDVLTQVDLFFPNEVELRALTGAADPAEGLRRLRNGRTRTVAKLGAHGCMTLDGDRVVAVPAFPVQPVDTTGAGDSFNAGFLDAHLAGRPVADCLRVGAACGALSTLRPGGTGGQPSAGELAAFLRSHG